MAQQLLLGWQTQTRGDAAMPTRSAFAQPSVLELSRLAVLLGFLAAVAMPHALVAQSCVLTRLDSPVMNAFNGSFTSYQKWQLDFGWRYGYSFRHFVGTDEQEERLAEHSQVVNNVNLADLSLRYNVNPRLSFTMGVPYLMANRDGGLRNSAGQVVKRYTRSETSGLGDVTLVGKWLVRSPTSAPRSNLSLGLGVKLPTGDYKQKETRLSLVGGQEVRSSAIADYSVQPGDGGYGVILESGGYKMFGDSGTFAGYGSGTYIVTPQGDNGVVRPGAAPHEEKVSVTDQYVARLGVQIGPAAWKGFTVGLGGRMEGIPVRDLVGSSEGRRRPGYMVSVEPSFSYTRGSQSITFAMPWAVERNRQRSVADLANGGHGDAAFPDYIVLSSYSLRF
jgi:hypothetical protein